MVNSARSHMTIDEIFDFAANHCSDRPITPAVQWISENFIDPISKQLVILQPFQRRILRRACEVMPDGSSRYELVLWSQVKKSGKTATAAAVASWVASEIESPQEVSCVANDQEQSAGRIFAAMMPTLQRLGWRTPTTPVGALAYNIASGSMVKAITTNYKGEAGGNQGLSSWSELWAYSGERLQRLWDELTPPPTRRFRMRWVETYAGFKNESKLLWGMYTRIFRDGDERFLQPDVVKLWDDLPVYELQEDKMLVFWDHSHRMPWQTPMYYRSQEAQLRPSSYRRLHGNDWQESIEIGRASCRERV